MLMLSLTFPKGIMIYGLLTTVHCDLKLMILMFVTQLTPLQSPFKGTILHVKNWTFLLTTKTFSIIAQYQFTVTTTEFIIISTYIYVAIDHYQEEEKGTGIYQCMHTLQSRENILLMYDVGVVCLQVASKSISTSNQLETTST